MIDHVQQLAAIHAAEIGLLGLAVFVGVIMRAYGRRLERRTREHSAARAART